MSQGCVWLHGDSLSPTDPALRANPQAPAVFVFDEDLLARYRLTFKRLFFLYESAAEALAAHPGGGDLRRGRVADELRAFAQAHGCDTVHVTLTESPRFALYRREIERDLRIETYNVAPFVSYTRSVPRFSRMWRAVEDEALSPTAREGGAARQAGQR